MKRIITFCMTVIMFTVIAVAESHAQKSPSLIPCRYGDKWGFADQQMKFIIEPVYDVAYPFYGDLAVVQKHLKKGLIDRNGNAVTPFKYDLIGSYRGEITGEYISVRIGDKFGLIDLVGKEIIPCEYDFITFVDSTDLYKVKANDKYGFYAIGKGEVLSADYDKINDLYEDVFVVIKGGKYGLVDLTGNLLVKPDLDYIWDFTKGTVSWYKTGDKYGYINNKGVLITGADFDMAWSFVNGSASVKKGEKFGCINEAGKLILPVEYDYISGFNEGYAVVGKENKYGLIDTKGNFITDLVYDGAWTPTEGLAKVKVGDLWGYVNARGKLKIPANFEYCVQFSERLATAIQDGKVGYINHKGEWVIKPQYELANEFLNCCARVVSDGKAFLISTDGSILTSRPYDSIGKSDEGLYPCWINGKEGRINTSGKEIVPPVYNSVRKAKGYIGERYLDVFSDKGKGIYSIKGVKILEAEYVFQRFDPKAGLVSLVKDGKWGFCDTLGNIVIPFEFEDVTGFIYQINGESYSTVNKNGLKGLLNTRGETVIPCKYNSLSLRGDYKVVVAATSPYNYGLISLKDEEILPFEYVSYFWDEADKSASNSWKLLRLKTGHTSQYIYVDAEGRPYDKPYQKEEVVEEAVMEVPVMRNTVMERITSKTDGRQYEISISLPFNYYNTNKTYPVIYLADGDMLQGIAAETSRMMCFDNTIPEVIIVGIGYGGTFDDWYNKRIWDMTPTNDTNATMFPGGGGCEAFYSFILKDLIPYIDREFRVAGNERTFAGYSLGGLFGAWMLFNKPSGTFNRYMLISPSLWWDKQLALKWEESFYENNKALPATVYMSLSEAEWGTPKTLNKTLQTRDYEGLIYTYDEIDGENHYSTFPAAFARGIRNVYSKAVWTQFGSL